jgi:hypothetical protein
MNQDTNVSSIRTVVRTQSLTLDGIGGCHPLLITNFNKVFSAGVVNWHVSYIL